VLTVEKLRETTNGDDPRDEVFSGGGGRPENVVSGWPQVLLVAHRPSHGRSYAEQARSQSVIYEEGILVAKITLKREARTVNPWAS
jgi:hypothetical protein